jgi:hypothetical protein
MPSPFPGMDPFLESAELFPDFHSGFVIFLQAELQKKLPEGYYATARQRIWLDRSECSIEPDEHIAESTTRRAISMSGAERVVVQTQPVVVSMPVVEHKQPFLEIYKDKVEQKRLVCTVEMLSLSNKKPGEKGQKLYRRKQREVLRSKTHLVEIDLLRAGKHTTAVPLKEALKRTGPFDYHACCHRFDRREDYFVYPIRLPERLPTLAVPLLPADGEVAVDLQAIFERAYEVGPYARVIDYAHDAVTPPLSPEQDAWARGLLA